MKRLWILLMAGLFCLTACTGKTPTNSDTSNTTVSVTDSDTDNTPTSEELSSLFAPKKREGTTGECAG